jgi:hypothetical protein
MEWPGHACSNIRGWDRARGRQLLSRRLTSGPKRASQRLGFPAPFNERRRSRMMLSAGGGSVIVAGADRRGQGPRGSPGGEGLGLNQKWDNKHRFAPSSDTSVTPQRFPPPWTVGWIGPVLINKVFSRVSLSPWCRLNKRKFLRPKLIQSLRRFVCKSAAKLPAQES